ncbi:unnamed protein product [Hymenolepis diminuta]|uniref:Secreted protein n=1 Tax=Hymenolepis diminuta TaxID=6216 RepID=A0A564XX36_HYMDI|nr:unnamed protein product [Hymenolepis diminuta]
MRLAMLILIVTSPVACIRSSLATLTESFLMAVRIAIQALLFIEMTVFIEVKIATSVYYSVDTCAVSEAASAGSSYFRAIGRFQAS